MSDDSSRAFPTGPMSGQPTSDYRMVKGMLAFWDLSKNPSGNNRLAKLGTGDRVHGVAIGSYDATKLTNTIIDGQTVPGIFNSWRMVEPDNWMLRVHDQKTADNVWALRLICDHENRKSVV